jgi:hypothetical protein
VREDGERIDYLWLLMEIAIAYYPNPNKKKDRNTASEEVFVCPDPPQEFATRIKRIDEYYGYINKKTN